jgi:ribosomal protein S20
MTDPPADPANGKENDREIARLAAELEEAELYEQRLRGVIAAVREELTHGNVERALSMLNEALNEIDDATDVVAHPRAKPDPNR